MSIEAIVITAVVVLGFIVLALLVSRRGKSTDSDGLLLLKKDLEKVREGLERQTSEMSRTIQGQFGESAKIIKDVTERLTKLDETNRQVLDFSQQLQNLQDILKNPKQRGVLGEYYLESVMKNVLPPGTYKMQHKFKDGEIVDAIINVKDKLIPVDSKFSLENYNRLLETRDPDRRAEIEKAFKQDLKFRIDETAKYVRPDEGTMDFAFMFIPSEAIYYDLLVNKVGDVKVATQDLIEYAFREKRVLIVSPTTFLAYLQTVLQGLRALQIEQSALEIRKRVEQLAKHLGSYDTYMQKLGNNLGTTVSMYNAAYKEFKKVDKDVVKIAEVESKIEPLELEKPQRE
ncbi:MAG: DNA recombination protein RmuC [Candidatus Kerfeldbacteria bacterium]|nr:DNA recombination protein RmuC [Candidatus Kerfeldbacteria bacterium]